MNTSPDTVHMSPGHRKVVTYHSSAHHCCKQTQKLPEAAGPAQPTHSQVPPCSLFPSMRTFSACAGSVVSCVLTVRLVLGSWPHCTHNRKPIGAGTTRCSCHHTAPGCCFVFLAWQAVH